MRLVNLAIIILFVIVAVISCRKENNLSVVQNAVASQTNEATSVCSRFKYSDTIFYIRPTTTDYIVKPVNSLAGTYGVFPIGLVINATNGNINVTKSETGLKYIVWFIPAGTTDTCKKFITISGVDYTDSIYSLSKLSVKAKPVYNANRTATIDCTNGCAFDDSATLVQQGIAIDRATGKIDLKKSIAKGALGTAPVNGAYKDFTLNYRLPDKSAKARNHIRFRLYYYTNKSLIPAKLLDELSSKKDEALREDDNNPYDDHGGTSGGNSGPGLTAKGRTGEVKCRPPYIIVTQQ